MIELSIPEIGENTRNTKDLVFTVLSSEKNLSIAELTERIQGQHNVNATYQAVRKAVNTLHSQKVLEKKGKKYNLSKEWVLNLKKFFDQLLAQYSTAKRINTFNPDLAKENYAVYTFSTLFELDNFWFDVMTYLAKHLKPDEPKEFVAHINYAWWYLINFGRETKLMEHYIAKKIDSYNLYFRDTPLNWWAKRIDHGIGVKTKIIDDKTTDDNMDIDILGNTIVQARYPEELLKKIRAFFKKYKSTSEMNLKELTEIAHYPSEIKFTIFKNPTIAKNLRETCKKQFR